MYLSNTQGQQSLKSALLLCLGLAGWLSSMPAAATERSVQVVAEPLNFAPLIRQFELVGSAEAHHSVTLYPAVGDRVEARHFSPGDYVNRGEVLLELDSRRQRNALERARIELADAERTVERLAASRAQDAAAQSELDAARTERDLRAVALADAEVEYADRFVEAPFSGYVGLTEVEVGDRITTDTPITTLDDRSSLLIEFTAPESALELLQNSERVEIWPWENAELRMQALLVELDSRVDEASRTMRVRALLPNPADLLRPGMSFRIRLATTVGDYAVVPEAALVWGANQPTVWFIDEDQQAQQVAVEIQQRRAGKVWVDGELEPGQHLITEGVQQLREGLTVRLHPDSELAPEREQ